MMDVKTNTKIALGFGCTVLVALILALTGRQALNTSNEHLTDIGRNRMPSIHGLQESRAGMLHMASGYRGLINRRMMDPAIRQANYDELNLGVRQMAEGRKIYESLPMTAEEERLWKTFGTSWDEFQRLIQGVVDLQREKDTLLATGAKSDDPRVSQLDDRSMDNIRRAKKPRDDSEAALNQVVELNNGYGKTAVETAEASASKSNSLMLVVMLLGIGIAVGIAISIIRSVSKALDGLRNETARLAEAAVAGQLQTRADATAVPAEFRGIVQGVNDTLDAVVNPLNVAADYVDKISHGNIPPKITTAYNGEFNLIKDNLNQLVETLNRFTDEMGNMSKQHDAGDIDVKIAEERFEGAYRNMAKGVNDMVAGHISVKKKAMGCIAEFGRGNFDAELERFPGKKSFINENIEKLRANVKAFIHDMAHMSKEHDAGDIDIKVPEEKFEGAYRTMAKGVNDMVAGHISVKKKAMGCIAEFAAGNFDAPLERFPGKKAFINENVELLRRNSKALIADANLLAKAALEGKLATRADANKHQGDFKKIVQGVNDTLDAVIGPLNVAADYVDRISKGQIPQKITETYQGDFNAIKNNLNKCIDAVNSLIADADLLAKAAIAGKLSTRADAGKHEGDFRKIVDGVNQTLDAVITPVMDATNALESLARYDMRARVDGDYQGDHARIKDALNGTAKALQDALIQVADAVEQVAEASQQIASSSQAVSQGASEQASSLEETSSSLEEMAGMTKQNADNTIQARSLAQTTKEAAEKGGKAMIRMTDAMEKIRAASEGTAEIIKDINDIAFQTNLLALNAAVEAARAGDAGRGFAVVAEEVRNLALRSKEAAKKTEDLIKVAVGHSENGRVITNEVAGSLTEIVTAAAKVNDIVSEIAVASQEQSRGIEQVNTAVAEMDKVVQTAASNAEESSSAAEELASQSEELSSLVQRFELDRDNRGTRRHLSAPRDTASVARRPGLHPASVVPPRRGAVTRPKKSNGTNGSARKPSPEELIPLESDPEFQDF